MFREGNYKDGLASVKERLSMTQGIDKERKKNLMSLKRKSLLNPMKILLVNIRGCLKPEKNNTDPSFL